jgi:UDP:flavonoid glycosyltransferase YjiC (YdhE family)
LRAGVPTVISPVAVDQFFWGRQVAALGVGVKLPSRHALTEDKLIEAIERVIHDEILKTKARELGNAIRGEDGVGQAVKILVEGKT